MKIAVIDPSLFTWPYDRALVGGLRSRGHEAVLFGKALPQVDVRLRDPVLRPVFYPALANTGSWPRPLLRAAKGFSHAGSLERLRRELALWAPDVIHFQWLPLPIVDRVFLPLLRRIAPTVLTVHDTMPFNGSPASALQALGTHAAFRQFDHLIVHTDQGRQRIAPYAGSGISRIPHGLLHDEAAAEPAAKSPGGARGPVTLLMFGQIKPYKGIDVLLRALAALDAETRARCHVCIAGKPYMDTAPLIGLRRDLGLEETVEFRFEFVPDAQLAALFDESAAVLFPYREIEASGALMAALAHAKPVIASRLGTFAELLEDQRHGLLVPPDDVAALAQAIGRFVREDGLRRHLTEEIGQLKTSIPSWEAIADQTIAAYDQAARRWSRTGDSAVTLQPRRRGF
jgi:glycosyltransferase involved in cell wall biosynthesis